MAWDDIAVNLTESYEVAAGSGGSENLYYSRWLYSEQQVTDKNIVHLVREVRGTRSTPEDSVGIHYIQYNLEQESVVRSQDVFGAAVSGTPSRRYPVISYHPTEGRLVCVYISTNSDSQNQLGAAGPLLYKTSTDGGATWSSEQTLGTDSYSWPHISFGLDGTGWLVAYNDTNSTYDVFEYQSAGTFSSPSVLVAQATTGTLGCCCVAVAHDGISMIIVDGGTAATNARPHLFRHNGASWEDKGRFATLTASVDTGLLFPLVLYDINSLRFVCCYAEYTGQDNAEGAYISRDGIVSQITNGGFSLSLSPLPAANMRGAIDANGDLHLAHRLIGSSDIRYRVFSDGVWDSTSFDWSDQDTDHGAASFPGSALAGAIAVNSPIGRIFFTADTDGGSSDEDLWTGENPELLDITTETTYGCIVKLATYNFGSSQRVMAYVGDGIYHDGGTREFVGNHLGNGAFEPVADFEVFEGLLFLTDGENGLKTWDGSSATMTTAVNDWSGNLLGEDIPILRGMVAAKNRIWGFNGQRVYFSELRNGTGWSATQATADEDDPGFIDMFDLPDGEDITGIEEFFGVRYVFSRNGIVKITGDTPYLGLSADTNAAPFLVSKVSSTIGAIAQHSIVNIGTDILFLSERGVHSLRVTETSGAVEENYISFPIQPIFPTLTRSELSRCQAVNYRKKNWYVLSVPEGQHGGMFKTLVIFDYGQQQWIGVWRFDFEICSLLALTPQNQGELLLAGTDRGYVVSLDQDSKTQEVGDATYTSRIRTMLLHGGDPKTYKKFTRLILHLKQPSITPLEGQYWVDDHPPVSFSASQSAFGGVAVIGTFIIGTDKIGGSGPALPVEINIPINRRGRTLMLEFFNTDGDFAIIGLEVPYIPGAFRGDIS